MSNLKSDKELILEIRSGDILAFEELVKRYQIKLLYFVLRIINSETDAEEIVQDTFVKIYSKIERIDVSKKFSTYLFEIAKNAAFSQLRKKKREVALDKAYALGEEDRSLENLIRSEDAVGLRKAVSKLSDQHRQVLELYYFKDFSYKQIATRLHMPINTIRTHLRRAKVALRKELYGK